MKIENFKYVGKLPVVASFDVFFEDKGYGIREFRLMNTRDTKWIAHPARQYKDQEGKNKYYQYTYFLDDRKKKFDEQVFALLKPFLDSAMNPPTQRSFSEFDAIKEEDIPF